MGNFNMDETARRLKERRTKDLNLKQSEVAKRTGITPQALSTYENGSVPRMDILWDLADALECEPDYILGRIKHPKRSTSEIAEKVALSREAIESLEQLTWEIKTYSDFDSMLISCILNDLIIYFVNELSTASIIDSGRAIFKEGLFDDIAHMLYAYENTFPKVNDSVDDREKYARMVIRATKTSIGDRLADCVANTITKIATQQENSERR